MMPKMKIIATKQKVLEIMKNDDNGLAKSRRSSRYNATT